MSVWGQLYFPDFNSEMAARLYYYHDLALIVVVVVSVLVLSFLISFLLSDVFVGESMHLKMKKHELLEVGWSTAPFFVLFGLGFVSLKNLYAMEVGENVEFLTKVTGHQWYWEYSYNMNFSELNNLDQFDKFVMSFLSVLDLGLVEKNFWVKFGDFLEEIILFDSNAVSHLSPNNYEDSVSMDVYSWGIYDKCDKVLSFSHGLLHSMNYCFVNSMNYSSVLSGISSLYLEGDWYFKYDAYIVPEDLLLESDFFGLSSSFRNQDVSVPCYLIRNEKNEVLVSTADVMHSWGVSELGVKADAVPGRENAVKVVPLRSGVAFGFCYELCGAGHSQMPICVLVANKLDVDWIIKSGILGTDSVVDFLSSDLN
uniref:Cytochrome c oxidase subunit 2 n=1 Tax=Meretrix lyrata TaxID=223151 RepID=V5JVA2_9BIVA|nr:cytochrome c oxidase subunit II [Meretrix lyrata]AGR50828.1 cytochrome c oxidase subunit II [Meretrix lyrata]